MTLNINFQMLCIVNPTATLNQGKNPVDNNDLAPAKPKPLEVQGGVGVGN